MTAEIDLQRTGRIFGLFFIGTFITSIPARLLFVDGVGATWTDMEFVPGAVNESSLRVGPILEFLLIGFNVATAVVIYPLVKRQSATVGLGYVTARIMESVFIAIGLISIISVISVNDSLAGATAPRRPRSPPSATLWCRSTNGHSSSGRDSLCPSGMGCCWAI